MRSTLAAALHLAGALLLGIPLGCLGYTLHEALQHPSFAALILHHPFIVLPALLAGGIVGAATWATLDLLGLDLLREATTLHGWIVGAACGIYLLTDRRDRPAR